MHQGDGFTSVVSGVFLSVTANVAGWVSSAGFGGHVLETLLFGFVGGLGGWAAKRCIEGVAHKLKTKRKTTRG